MTSSPTRRRLLTALAALAVVVSAAVHAQRRSIKATVQAYGITDERILKGLAAVDRRDYLPEEQKAFADRDAPLPIGHEQTTSQPSLIAQMVDLLKLPDGARVLEVGTGSGYQTALLATFCRDVYSIDIVEPLAVRARAALKAKGFTNVHVRAGDGYLGWPEAAPFDGVVVSAGARKVPQPLLNQLKPGGRLVIPVGAPHDMHLEVHVKAEDGSFTTSRSLAVRFVPLTGDRAEADRKAPSR